MSNPPTPQKPPENKPASKSIGKGKAFGILGGILLVGAMLGIAWYWHASQFEQTDDAMLQGHVHPVAARVPGTVSQVLVDDNVQVKAGQLVAVLDDRDYRLALSQAENELLNAKARVKTALSTVSLTERQAASQLTQAQGSFVASQAQVTQSQRQVEESRAAVAQAQAVLEQQNAALQKAQADYQRYQNVDPNAISAQQRDVVAAQLRSAQAGQLAAQSALREAQARQRQSLSLVSGNVGRVTQSRGVIQGARAQGLQVQVTQNEAQAAQIAVKTAEDQVRLAQLNLSYTKIIAPVSGRVGKKTVEVGQRIQPGEPLMAVVSPDLWVVANYKETQLSKMRPGQSVEIEVDAFPHHHLRGVVDSFSPASGAQFALLPAENATGNFTKIVQRVPVKILIEPKTLEGYESLMVPGMSTVVTVNVAEKPKNSRVAQAPRRNRI